MIGQDLMMMMMMMMMMMIMMMAVNHTVQVLDQKRSLCILASASYLPGSWTTYTDQRLHCLGHRVLISNVKTMIIYDNIIWQYDDPWLLARLYRKARYHMASLRRATYAWHLTRPKRKLLPLPVASKSAMAPPSNFRMRPWPSRKVGCAWLPAFGSTPAPSWTYINDINDYSIGTLKTA